MAKPMTEKIVAAKEKIVEVKKENASAERALTVEEEIGFTAGKIWHALQAKELSLSKLKTTTKAQPNLLMMGLGWLAREDKVEICKNKKTYSIRLK